VLKGSKDDLDQIPHGGVGARAARLLSFDLIGMDSAPLGSAAALR
jgi:hypothetical protein